MMISTVKKYSHQDLVNLGNRLVKQKQIKSFLTANNQWFPNYDSITFYLENKILYFFFCKGHLEIVKDIDKNTYISFRKITDNTIEVSHSYTATTILTSHIHSCKLSNFLNKIP